MTDERPPAELRVELSDMETCSSPNAKPEPGSRGPSRMKREKRK